MFVHRKDGTLATVMLSMNAYRGDKGRIERSICLMHDVTDQKIAEIASARSDQRFRGAFSAAAHGMALVSPTGQIELSNAAFGIFLGRQDIDKSTLTFDETLHRDDRGQFLNGMRQLLSGEVPSLKQELRYMTGSGGSPMAPPAFQWSKARTPKLSSLWSRLSMSRTASSQRSACIRRKKWKPLGN